MYRFNIYRKRNTCLIHLIIFELFSLIILAQSTAFNGCAFYRHFRKIAKSDYELHHVCLSVRPHATVRSIPLQWEIFWTKVVEKTYFMFSNFSPRKSFRMWDSVEKYGKVGQATDKNIIWRMRIAC